MRFRKADWDITMPPALVAYWTAWNSTDLTQIAGLLLDAVTDEIEWNDPRDSFVGISELEAAIRRLRTSKPQYQFTIASEIDHHHNRCRYQWEMTRNGRTLMEGLDIATLDQATGKINRVDGFFGHPTTVKAEHTGIPHTLHR